ncbi:MAG: hypothetical protein A4E66_02022 [Syntrophus sp. PtaB.Bin001]|nr:MAG: hypothetical protein A4E66_02022 [Syntrophus sp. PtaB.Bin001]
MEERNKKMTLKCKKARERYLPSRRISRSMALILLSVVLGLTGCYYAPYRTVPQPVPAGEEQSMLPLTQLYFYPKKGQTVERQSRDHYECYNWAVKMTGFDPSRSAIPRNQRVSVVPMPPPGWDTATMAIAGAVLGALIGGPHHAGEGALIGATGGAIAGAASDVARQESARQIEEAYNTQTQVRNAQLAEQASRFRRAMSACMEGRGYSVY